MYVLATTYCNTAQFPLVYCSHSWKLVNETLGAVPSGSLDRDNSPAGAPLGGPSPWKKQANKISNSFKVDRDVKSFTAGHLSAANKATSCSIWQKLQLGRTIKTLDCQRPCNSFSQTRKINWTSIKQDPTKLNIGLIPYCFKIGLNPYCLPSVFSLEFILVDCQFSTFPFGYCLTQEG